MQINNIQIAEDKKKIILDANQLVPKSGFFRRVAFGVALPRERPRFLLGSKGPAGVLAFAGREL